jgi:hypothetical protein
VPVPAPFRFTFALTVRYHVYVAEYKCRLEKKATNGPRNGVVQTSLDFNEQSHQAGAGCCGIAVCLLRKQQRPRWKLYLCHTVRLVCIAARFQKSHGSLPKLELFYVNMDDEKVVPIHEFWSIKSHFYLSDRRIRSRARLMTGKRNKCGFTLMLMPQIDELGGGSRNT